MLFREEGIRFYSWHLHELVYGYLRLSVEIFHDMII